MARQYHSPLSERLKGAERDRRRYWECSATRLKVINRARAVKGLPPYSSLDQVQPYGGQPKDALGRFRR